MKLVRELMQQDNSILSEMQIVCEMFEILPFKQKAWIPDNLLICQYTLNTFLTSRF